MYTYLWCNGPHCTEHMMQNACNVFCTVTAFWYQDLQCWVIRSQGDPNQAFLFAIRCSRWCSKYVTIWGHTGPGKSTQNCESADFTTANSASVQHGTPWWAQQACARTTLLDRILPWFQSRALLMLNLWTHLTLIHVRPADFLHPCQI